MLSCRTAVLLAHLSSIGLATAASAADLPGRLYSSISLTSDYRYNGVSYSGRDPAPQASLHWLGARGWYAGVWTSSVDFDDPGNTSIEADVYAGRELTAGRTRIAAEALYTFFPDRSFAGPTYDFLQLKVRGSRSFEALTVGALAAWSPRASYGSGTAWRAAVDASYAINNRLKVGAAVGRRWIQTGADRSFWDAGVTASWRRIALDVRYVDTNLDARRCDFTQRCSGAMVATLSWRFW